MTDVDRLRAAGIPERIISKIVFSPGCWEYLGSHTTYGYARTWIDSKQCMVHRLTASAINGEPEVGQQADHLCRNRGCVRPSHVEWVSSAENTRRGESRAALTMQAVEATGLCPNGHDMTLPDAWAVFTRKGKRRCRLCANESLRRSRDNNREAVRERDRIRKREARRAS